jgi:TolB-like protein
MKISIRQACTVGLLLIVFLLVQAGWATQESQSSKQKMDDAMRYYSEAKFDKAIEILDGLANDNTLDKNDKKEVLLGLGRAYVAKGLKDKATWAIDKLLDLEPPAIEPDPDAEAPPLMKIYYDVRKKKTGSSSVERPDPGIQTIAILDFKNRSVDDKEKFDPMEKGFAELMINQLQGSINLKVVERERIQWILDEIGLENDPGKFDVNSAVRVGKQLGVHSILLGSFIKLKDKIKLLARLVKVETSEILATEEASGDADEFFETTENLGVKVAKKINVSLTKADAEKSKESKVFDAVMSYSEGLVFLEKGNYKSAYEKFMQALTFDPNYEKAKTKAESIKPLLG